MLQKKICLLGAFAVGKTSLVARLVKGIFSDKYHTTIGVKIDKKLLAVGSQQVNLLVWDLAGEDEFLQIRMSYLRGSAGYLLVVDGTRPATLETALQLQKRVEETVGQVPFLAVLNKSDLTNEWAITDETIAALVAKGWEIIKTSARSGTEVEEAFLALAKKMVEQ